MNITQSDTPPPKEPTTVDGDEDDDAASTSKTQEPEDEPNDPTSENETEAVSNYLRDVAELRRISNRLIQRSGNRYPTTSSSPPTRPEELILLETMQANQQRDEFSGAGDNGRATTAENADRGSELQQNHNVVVSVDLPNHARIALCLGAINTMIIFYILILEVYKTVLLF